LLDRQPLEVSVDTEFSGSHTLTIQACCRIGKDALAVQVYRSADVPRPPRGFDPAHYLLDGARARFVRRILYRPVKLIEPTLSPVRMVAALLGISGLRPLSRADGQALIDGSEEARPTNASWDARRRAWRTPTIRLVLVGHFLSADLGRVFGRDFYAGLF